MMPDGYRRPHPYTGLACGTFRGPDGPRESNHSGVGRRHYAGLSMCTEIAGVNPNRHEQNHSRKGIHLRSLNNMVFATFTYSLRLINEVQNEENNRKTVESPRQSGGPPTGQHGCLLDSFGGIRHMLLQEASYTCV